MKKSCLFSCKNWTKLFQNMFEVKYIKFVEKTFQLNSDFEISGSAISEKITDDKTLPSTPLALTG